jgi:hypothetical protein
MAAMRELTRIWAIAPLAAGLSSVSQARVIACTKSRGWK